MASEQLCHTARPPPAHRRGGLSPRRAVGRRTTSAQRRPVSLRRHSFPPRLAGIEQAPPTLPSPPRRRRAGRIAGPAPRLAPATAHGRPAPPTGPVRLFRVFPCEPTRARVARPGGRAAARRGAWVLRASKQARALPPGMRVRIRVSSESCPARVKTSARTRAGHARARAKTREHGCVCVCVRTDTAHARKCVHPYARMHLSVTRLRSVSESRAAHARPARRALRVARLRSSPRAKSGQAAGERRTAASYSSESMTRRTMRTCEVAKPGRGARLLLLPVFRIRGKSSELWRRQEMGRKSE